MYILTLNPLPNNKRWTPVPTPLLSLELLRIHSQGRDHPVPLEPMKSVGIRQRPSHPSHRHQKQLEMNGCRQIGRPLAEVGFHMNTFEPLNGSTVLGHD